MYNKRKNNKDLTEVLQNLRENDKEELEALIGKDWYEKVLPDWKKMKGTRIGYLDNGKPVLVFGTYSIGDVGIIGMLATQNIEQEQRSFLIQGKSWIDKQMKKHKLLINRVYSKNKLAIKWLKWLGFTVEKQYGLGERFLLFYKGDLSCAMQVQ